MIFWNWTHKHKLDWQQSADFRKPQNSAKLTHPTLCNCTRREHICVASRVKEVHTSIKYMNRKCVFVL